MNKCVTLPSNNIISVMAVHNDLGRKGEDMAAEYLQHEGYCILARNWVNKGRKELDIVATKDDVVVFVEVKTRSTSDLASPEITIPPSKRRNLAAAINHYIKSNYVEYDFRFDVITVIGSVGYEPKIEHLIDVNLF